MFGKTRPTTRLKVMIAAALLTGSVTASLALMAGGCGVQEVGVYDCCPIPDGGIPDAALPYPDDQCGTVLPWCGRGLP
jgi:hypothetical protein